MQATPTSGSWPQPTVFAVPSSKRPDTRRVHLVRHAHAGSRRAWEGDDVDRPLSARGRHQAAHITDLLAGTPVAAIVSSPAVRCTGTVAPLGEALGLEVVTDPALGEGAEPHEAASALLGLLDGAPVGDVVACSHGDVIPGVVALFADNGMRLPSGTGARLSKKGSVWSVEVANGTATNATYHPPGA